MIHELGYLNDRERDVVVYNFGPRVPAAKNNISQFMLDDDLGYHDEQAGALITARYHESLGSFLYETFILANVFYETQREATYAANKESDYEFRNINSYSYFAPSQNGDCGGLVIGCGKRTTRKILGIHVGMVDGTGRGYSEPIFQADLAPFLETHSGSVQGVTELPPCVIQEQPRNFNSSSQCFSLLGRIEKKDQVFAPTQTSLVRSPYFECLGPSDKEPAVLSPRDPRPRDPFVGTSPLLNGVAKYSKQSGPFPTHLLRVALDGAIDYWGKPSRLPKKYHYDIATNGIPGLPFHKSLNFASSAGLPFSTQRLTKRDLFIGEKPLAQPSSLLIARLDERIKLARQGLRIADSRWQDVVKDELRPIEKIRMRKSRIIANGPVDFTMAGRMFGLDFFADFYSSYPFTPSSVGMDCESTDYHDMMSYLFEVSNVGFAGDFGRFDGTLSPQIMFLFAELWNEYMQSAPDWNDEDTILVNTLVDEIIHTVHQCLDGVYIIHGGNPSGQFATIIMNTFVNWMYFAVAWLELAPPHLATITDFKRLIRLKLCGDDVIIAVAPEAISFYNMSTASSYFAAHDIEFLPPTKSGNSPDTQPLTELMFLKRLPRRLPELDSIRWVGSIDLSTIHSIIDWNTDQKGVPPQTAAEINLNMALRFAFFHGRKYFETLRNKLLSTAKERHLFPPKLHTWLELHNQYTTHGAILEPGEAQSDEIVLPKENQIVEGTPALGVQILQPEPTIMAPVTNAPHYEGSRAKAMIPETPWNLTDMPARFSQVDHFQWSTSDTRLTIKKQYSIPFDLIFNQTTNVPFQFFTFTRFTTKIQATCTGPKTSQGKLLYIFTPGYKKVEAANRHCTNLCSATAVTNFGLGPNQSSAGMEIPFYNINSYMNTANPDPNVDFVGTLSVIVMNPLFVDPNSSIHSCDVNLYCEFIQSAFHLPQSDTLALRRMNPLYLSELNVRQSDLDKVRITNFMKSHLSRSSSFSEITEEETYTLEEFQQRFPHIKIKERGEAQGSSSSSNKADTSSHTNNTAGGNNSNNTTSSTRHFVGGDEVTIYNYIQDDTMTETPSKFQRSPPGPPPMAGSKGTMGGGGGTGNNSGNIGNTDSKGGAHTGTQSSSATTEISPKTDVSIPAEMDKPPTVFHIRQETEPTTVWAHGTGRNYATRLDLTQRPHQAADAEHFATAEDEMYLPNLWQKTSFLTAFTTPAQTTINTRQFNFISITDGTTVGTIIAEGIISPVSELYDPGLDTGGTQKLFISNLCYYTCKKTFWSGGLVLTFEFICTEQHNIDLLFTPHYGIYTVPTDLGAATSQYSTYFKLGPGNTVLEVTIPNIFQRQFQRVFHGGSINSNNTSIGTWSLRTLSQLNFPSTANHTIEGNIYIGGAKNFRAWGDYGNNKSLVPICGQCSERGTAQASAPDISGAVAHQGQLLTNFDLVPHDPSQFGSEELDLRTSFKRMIPLGIYTDINVANQFGGQGTFYTNEVGGINSPPNGVGLYQYPLVIGAHTAAEIWSHGLPGWYAPSFRYHRGSVQFAFLLNCNSTGADAIGDFSNYSAFAKTPKWRTIVTCESDTRFYTDFYPGVSGSNVLANARAQGTMVGYFGFGSYLSSNITNNPQGTAYALCSYTTFDPYVQGQPPNDGTTNTGNTGRTLYNSIPLTISSSENDWHNVTIPFLTEYPVLYMAQASKAGTGATDINLFTHSSVLLAILMNVYDLFDQNGKQQWSFSYTLMGSMGDDARCGGFLGPPAVTFTNILIPTDSTNLADRVHHQTPSGDNYPNSIG
jgi:hypothetical protein